MAGCAEGSLTWCWELAGRGPDWLLLAEVAGGADLAGLAARAAPAGFVALPAERPGALELLDAASAAADPRRNRWVYNAISVAPGQIRIESGYGGCGEQLSQAETALLLALLAAPGVALGGWQVLAGGNGYDFELVRAGVGAHELRAYLGAR